MPTFTQAVNEIYQRDSRFHPDAYHFLKDALDYTIKRVMEREKKSRHINGPELMHGFRDYALAEFGPMTKPLLKEWGVVKTRDVGDMVYNLIEDAIFTKEDGDSPSDFDRIYSFKEAFETPFLPAPEESEPLDEQE